jgi:hypothetical protein
MWRLLVNVHKGSGLAGNTWYSRPGLIGFINFLSVYLWWVSALLPRVIHAFLVPKYQYIFYSSAYNKKCLNEMISGLDHEARFGGRYCDDDSNAATLLNCSAVQLSEIVDMKNFTRTPSFFQTLTTKVELEQPVANSFEVLCLRSQWDQMIYLIPVVWGLVDGSYANITQWNQSDWGTRRTPLVSERFVPSRLI